LAFSTIARGYFVTVIKISLVVEDVKKQCICLVGSQVLTKRLTRFAKGKQCTSYLN